jgi:hypothetical protein
MPFIHPVLAAVAGVLAVGLILILLRISHSTKVQTDQLAILLGMGKEDSQLEKELEAYAARLSNVMVQSREQLETVNRHLARIRLKTTSSAA